MEIGPILSSLRRNKLGAALIALQIALTLAIVCNSLFIIDGRTTRMQRPSGVDEANVFTLGSQLLGRPQDVKSRVQADLAALRSLPGVVDAMASNSFPLRGRGSNTRLDRERRDTFDSPAPRTARYFVDEHVGDAWGLSLLAGRWFTAGDTLEMRTGDQPNPAAIIVTKALAEQLFPGQSAVGRTAWFLDKSTQIVGVVETLQTPWAATDLGETYVSNAVLLPVLYLGNGLQYSVRTRPGERDATLQAARRLLFELDRARVVDNLRPFEETRAQRYRGDRALRLILGAVSALLLGVTACGIVGITNFWIVERRGQIGVRRALGATRMHILRYFHTENLLIAGAGVAIGVVLAVCTNLWMVKSFQMTRMGAPFVLAGAVIVIVLGQCAVLWPALRAASVPPALATRSG
jgi:putative ABC transport system permease protein